MSSSSGPDIITNGLILSLDAANRKSYPGSGTTWFDRSGNSNNGTLTNGPTFSSTNGGSIVFDGINDWANFPSNSNYNVGTGDFSIFCWIKSSNKNNYQTILSLDNAANGNGILLYTNVTNGVLRTWVGNVAQNGSVDITNNTWNYIGIVKISGSVTHYINSVSNVTFVSSNSVVSNQNLRLGSYDGADYMYNGNISQVSIYNKALSQSEIKQNFNATKSRFGL